MTSHAMTPTGTVATHPTFATSPTDITHATPQTRASLSPATPTAHCTGNTAMKSQTMSKTFNPP